MLTLRNLYQETLRALANYGYYIIKDVDFIRNSKGTISLDAFTAQAKTINYDSGFGRVEIDHTLVIAMHDGTWFERAIYDGSEWWVRKNPPINDQNPLEHYFNLREEDPE